ncbi:MAG TPA: YetF domain-containing protein [Candidatus Dormibacteraeota bacterium]|nr:YetF domain-containing protein [Candidatus Dormibacteraeota bacterium]
MGDIGEIFKLAIPWSHLVIRALAIYIVFFIGLRLFGKRELGQFTTFDLVLVLLIANALQPAITGPDNSVTGGVIIIGILLLFNRGVAMVRSRWPWFDELIEPPPTVVVQDGAVSKAALDKEGLSETDVEMAIREHGVDKLSDVKQAVLENDGSISVVTKGSGERYRRRRRVRFLKR